MKNKLAFSLGILSEFLVTFTTSKDSKKIPPSKYNMWKVQSFKEKKFMKTKATMKKKMCKDNDKNAMLRCLIVLFSWFKNLNSDAGY